MLSDKVYEQLLGMLTSGAWLKDSRLPSENELARRFAVSRPILRQALARLRTEGRIESRKGAGSYVREIAGPVRIDFGPLGNIAEVRRFLEFRCSVESELAARATVSASPAAIAAIQRAQDAMAAALNAGEPGIEEDVAFHLAIADASGNRFFVATLAAIAEHMRFGIRLTRELTQVPPAERIPRVIGEHARIRVAMERGSPEDARAAMHDHLNSGIRRLFGS